MRARTGYPVSGARNAGTSSRIRQRLILLIEDAPSLAPPRRVMTGSRSPVICLAGTLPARSNGAFFALCPPPDKIALVEGAR